MDKENPFMRSKANASPGFLLWQVSMVWQRKVSASLKPHSFTQAQFVLLASLMWLSRQEKNITQVHLAQHAKMDVMTVSQVLRTLEKKKYLLREAHPQDTRAKVLRLTKTGEAHARKLVPIVENLDDEFFRSLGNGKIKMLSLLQTLIEKN